MLCDNREQLITEKTLWYPFIILTANPFLHKILELVLHLIPVAIMDLILKITGSNQRLISVYRQATAATKTVSFAIQSNLNFNCTNMIGVYDR